MLGERSVDSRPATKLIEFRQASEPSGVPECIRRVATSLFTTGGHHGTPVRAIAHEVGIEAASLYYYFPSKQHLL
jgi:Bacterial regulatory proteins, tetR family